MCLLPIHDLPRLIFLDAREVTNLLILERARWHQGDYKSIIRSADACLYPMKSDPSEYFSILAHGDAIFELAAPPPGKRGAR